MRRWLTPSVVVVSLSVVALAQDPPKTEGPRTLRFEAVPITLEFSAAGADQRPDTALAVAFSGMPQTLWRARIPSGWLVSCGQPQLFFVQDPEHTWDGGSIPR